ncbi:D-alanyl-D-alanine carboxypeptidase family protein [Lentilactobacillus kefiri]|uniref:D-alanyl-D-alanine carboxypeptidase family protein n=1 Tax=Lentilactobacillus kefiri TaxID=33962 RepID=UPI00345E1B90
MVLPRFAKRYYRQLNKMIMAIVIMIAGFALFNTQASAKKVNQQKFQAKEAYVMDAKTGQVLYQKNGNNKRPIASLSKLMTLYLTKKAIDNHQISWDQKVPVDSELRKMSKSYEVGGFRIKRSKEFTVRDLYKAALIASSNPAAISLGKLVGGGSNTEFVKMMNQQSKKWGLDATFVSSSGLDNSDLGKYHYRIPHTSKKAQNMVSAKAISTVAAKVLEEFPSITKWSKQPSMKVGKQVLVNSNRLLPGGAFYHKSTHVDGLKTGFTVNAGLCITVTYWHDGRHLIATIIDSNTLYTSMNKLIKTVNSKYHATKVALKSHPFSIDGHQLTAQPAESEAVIWQRNGTSSDHVVNYTATKTQLPIVKGQTVGNAIVKLADNSSTATVPMKSTVNIKKKTVKTKKAHHHVSMLSRIFGFVGGIFGGIYHLFVEFVKFMTP